MEITKEVYIDEIGKNVALNTSKKKLRKKFYSPEAIQMYMDVLSVFIGYLIYYYIRFESGWFYNINEPDSIFWIIIPEIVYLTYWLIVFWFSGLYKNWYIRSPFDELFTTIRIVFFGSFVIFIVVLFDSAHSPRLFFLLGFFILAVTVSSGRIISRRIQKKLREKGKFYIPALLIGNYSKSIEFYEKIRKSPAWGYKPIGLVLTDKNEYNSLANSLDSVSPPIVGLIDDLEGILINMCPEEVLITIDSSHRELLLYITNKCAERGIKVKIVPDLYDIITGLVRTLPLYGIPLIEISTQLLKPWEESIKRIIDIIFSFLVVIIGLPFWLLTGLAIKLESVGTIFYKQERVGKDNKPFILYKFRSMKAGSDKNGPQWTQVNDPRVTKLGYILRKTHIDEIPQFLNVLKGQMSIVGPRPEITAIVAKYSLILPYYKRRLVVRPGITGWWQVNYTSYEETTEEIESRLKDDFYYIENMSLKLDLEIMVRTVVLMIKGHGQT